jgi:hypothetical protein
VNVELVISFVDALDRAHINARLVFRADAGFDNNMWHLSPPADAFRLCHHC